MKLSRLVRSAALATIILPLALAPHFDEALAETAAQSVPQSVIFLCNETSFQIVAMYTLTGTATPLSLTQGLDPLSGKFGDASACFPLRIPNYAGPITFTGMLGDRRFPSVVLTTAYDRPAYVWYYNEGTACWTTTTSYKACLEL
jgi:hypothetical protein